MKTIATIQNYKIKKIPASAGIGYELTRILLFSLQ